MSITLDGTTGIAAVNLRQYASGNQTWTAGGTITLAHGLGVVPSIFTFRLVCLTAEAGYTAGEIVVVGTNWNRADTTPVGFTPRIDSTNITIAYNSTSTIAIVPKTGGGITNITPANWALNILAFG
jgi:hypothetical protein